MIKWVADMGLAPFAYRFMQALGLTVAILFNVFWYSKKYELSKLKAFLTSVMSYILSYILMLIYCWAESGFTSFGALSSTKCTVYFIGMVSLTALIFKVEVRRLCDFIAPGVLCFGLGIGKLGCVLYGCCHGFPSAFGVYSRFCSEPVFPVSLFEAITVTLAGVALVLRAKSNNYKVDGLTFPLAMMFVGALRFFWSLALDDPKTWFGLSERAPYNLLLFFGGLIIYIAVSIYNKKTEKQAEDRRS